MKWPILLLLGSVLLGTLFITACQSPNGPQDFSNGQTIFYKVDGVSVFLSVEKGEKDASAKIMMGTEEIGVTSQPNLAGFQGKDPLRGISRLIISQLENDVIWIQFIGMGGASAKAHLPEGKSVKAEYNGTYVLIVRDQGVLRVRVP